MRNDVPTRWIEQAETRRVLTQILSERMPVPPRCTEDDAALHLPARLLFWLARRHPVDWAASLIRVH